MNISPYMLADQLSDEKKQELYPSLDPLLAQLLFTRDIQTESQINQIFSFDYGDLHAPFLFKDMDIAVERVLKVLDAKEKICLYTDYDTDGIPAGALLYSFFTKIGYENFFNYIPHRNKEGYSLNMKACEQFIKDGVTLLITADCGITDTEEVTYLMENGCDVIITDHHLPEGDLPGALAVIDHKIKDNTYPDTNLCGCAIAWKLVVALIEEGKKREMQVFVDLPDGWEKTLLDLVAISTICDMVPLVGENRLLVHFGMRVLNMTRRPGLRQIMKKARLSGTLGVDDVAFMIGPRINAASRLEDPMISFTALAKQDESAIAAADDLERINNERKKKTATIMRSVWKRLGERELGDVIVIGDRSWPLGILGLIANKIAERYERPAFVWSELDGKIKGSCRSGSDISVFSLMDKARAGFSHFGGHAASGGFVTTPENIVVLENTLVDVVGEAERIAKDQQQIDAVITERYISESMYQEISKLEPFGMKYPKPLFAIKIDAWNTRVFGKTNDHLEIQIPKEYGYVKAVAFYCEDLIKKAETASAITIIGNIIKETYNGRTTYGMRIVDII